MKLIDDWFAKARQLWSVRLAAVFGLIAATVVASPELLLGLINYVPEALRPFAAAITGLVAFVVPMLSRLMVQSKLADTPKEASDAE